MKSHLPVGFILISILSSTGCTRLAPSTTVSEVVIKSILPTPRPEMPWRLDSAWQGGGLAGAVLRRSSIEHVVRQVDNTRPRFNADFDQGTAKISVANDTRLKSNCNSNSLLK